MLFDPFFKKNLNTLSSSESLVLKRLLWFDFNSSEEINKDDKKNEDVVDADFEEVKPEDDKKNAS